MEIGVGMVARIDPHHPRSVRDAYHQIVDEAVLAEELGFAGWWLAEHHFSEDSHTPAQFPLLAAVAMRTSTIRMGTFALLLPFHHPLLVAENAATVDILSDGRLELVIGPGPIKQECDVFGVPLDERFNRTYEALEVIEKAFSGERFSHHGTYWRFDDVQVTPAPVQPGGPPISIAAMAPQSLARAARRGYGCASALHTKLLHVYEGAQAEAGRSRDAYTIRSGPLLVHCAETRDRAWDEAQNGLSWFQEFYKRRGFPFPFFPPEELRHIEDVGVFGQPFAVGTPDDVLRVLERHKGVDLDEMVIQFNHPGMAPDAVERGMRLFARELMPELRTWGRQG